MFKDRRFYKRVNINKECIIYIKEQEINCIINDISEGGISFKLDKNEDISYLLDNILVNFDFYFIDKFRYFEKNITSIVNGKCKVVRIEENKNEIILGCELIYDKNIQDYILKKKTSIFMEKYFKG